MKMKSLILIFIALGCGLVASIGISQVMSQGGGEAKLEMDQILVAKDPIDSGKPLQASMVQLEEWPKNKIPDGALRKVEDLEGMFSKYRFFKGEPILQAKISDKRGGVIEDIPPGYRVSNIKVDEDTVMEAITPGDSVDVNVFLEAGRNGINKTGVYTILRNVRVFAKGGQTERSIDEKGQEVRARTVSLLVKPEQLRQLVLAYHLGRISLGLRPPNASGDEGQLEETTSNIDDIIGGSPTDGSEPVQGAGDGTQSIAQFINPQAGNGPKPLHSMVVFGPGGGISQYDWHNADGVPVERKLSLPDSEAPAPAPNTAPAPANSGNPAAPATP
jgi:pilus assembly protein CpaB